MDLLQEMQVRFGVGSPVQQEDGESRADWLVRLMWLLSQQSELPSYYGDGEVEEYKDSGRWGADRLDTDCPVAVVRHERSGQHQVMLYSHGGGNEEVTLEYAHDPDYVADYGQPEAIIMARPDGTAEWKLGGPR